MKSAIILSIFAICLVGVYSASVKETEEKWISSETRCIQNTGVDTKLLKKIDETHAYVKDPKVDCFFACLMQVDGAMDENGKMDTDNPKYTDEGKECIKLHTEGKNACEKAGKITECIMAKVGEKIKKEKEAKTEKN